VQRLETIGRTLRESSADALARSMDEAAGLKSGVLSRLQAERHEALTARIGRMFNDMHLVWAAMGATCATVVCIASMLAMLHFASSERADSLAALLEVMASPGSNENPVPPDLRMALPRAFSDAVMPAMLVGSSDLHEDLVVLAGIITREGRMVEPEVLSSVPRSSRPVDQLLTAVSAARFEPARSGGSPVAVNLVWLLAHTTVRAKSLTIKPLTTKSLVS